MPHLRLSNDFALLVPVPEEHLRSGAAVARDSGFLALGNDTPDFFDEVDALRENCPVPVLFYASRKEGGASEVYTASWLGWYVGRASPRDGRHPAGGTHRPPTAAADGEWKVFYHVVGLRELGPDEVVRVDSLEKYKSPGELRANARVRGPGLVRIPSSARSSAGAV